MTIHHTQLRKAEKIGVALSEHALGIDAFWPQANLHIIGASVADAIEQVKAAQAINDGVAHSGHTALWSHHPTTPRLANVRDENNKWLASDYRTPHELLTIWKADGAFQFDVETPPLGDELAKEDIAEDTGDKPVEIGRSDAGVALDGAVAYAEGTASGDCPYDSETEEETEYNNFIRWNEEWDNAADAASEAEDKVGGSVVKDKYRLRYAEQGHPTHCGDWLAELLNNLVLGKKATDIARFEDICALNGVSLAAYKHEGKGWEGRLRMTGRNLLAKKVYYAEGVLHALDLNGEKQDFQAPAEWMAAQRFKPAPKAEPTPAT